MPDLVLLKPRADYCASERHTPADTFLVVEVSDTTLRFDGKIKVPLFATAGIPEVWIADLHPPWGGRQAHRAAKKGPP